MSPFLRAAIARSLADLKARLKAARRVSPGECDCGFCENCELDRVTDLRVKNWKNQPKPRNNRP